MEDSTFDEREELMVSPFGGIPQLRKAQFLKPIVSSIEGPNLKLPSLPFSSESEWPMKVSFNGCRHHQNKWKKWVETLEPAHHDVWKAAGIYEAIMSSVYKVHTQKDLIFGLTERWCCETNTFVFPWGEATLTLEDMMILGGFSVLGGSVLLPLQSHELVEIEENLERTRRDLIGLKADNHTKWLNFFMDSGKVFEHEAFLSLWLSRFVFPGNEYDKIGKHVFPIAVNLARGIRLALAPVVLASIYRDLSLLKQSMIMASSNEPSSSTANDGDRFNILEFSLWAPLFFVQVWAWERLLPLRPEQPRNYNMVSGVRIGRWHNVKQSSVINVRTTIDSSGETFQWRPYTLAVEGWLIPKFYNEKEEWVKVEGENFDQELESFFRCLRVSELVGLDCQEPYRPNRVAMQFGYDQGFPKWIPRSPSSPELAWYTYSRPIDSNLRLHYPSRLFEADVTTQYLKWWRKEVLFLTDVFKGWSHGRRSKRRLKWFSNLYDSPVFAPKLKQVKVETHRDVCDILPGLPPECQLKQCCGENDKKNLSMGVSQIMACDFVPPGFVVKHNAGEIAHPSTDAHNRNESSIVILPKCNGENDKEDLSLVVCQTVACDVVPLGLMEKHNAGERVHPSTDEQDSNECSSIVLPKCNGENDKENLSMRVYQTVACDVVPPGSAERQTDSGQEEGVKRKLKRLSNIYDSPAIAPKLKLVKVETPWDAWDVLPGQPIECHLKQVENYPDAPPGFPPKYCGGNDKKNLPRGVSETMGCDVAPPAFVVKHIAEERAYPSTEYALGSNGSSSIAPPMACGIVPPGLTEKHNAGENVHTSTDAHDSNESSSVVPPKCVVEYDKEDFTVEVCQTVSCDVVSPGSTENHTDYEHDRNESNSNIAHNLLINEKKRGSRTYCDDLITAIEVRLSRLEKQAASLMRG
ncbi:unnamed protein product [Withania somnifera]